MVIGRSFVHPGLGIRFEAPPGFRLVNTPEAVIGQRQDGAIMKFDMDNRQTQDIPSYLQQQWPGPQSVRAVWPASVDGHEAASGLAIGKVGSRTQQAVVGAVDAGEGRVWRFLFVAPQMDQRSAGAYQQSIESLQFLSPAEAARFNGQRIQVYTVKPGDRLAGLMNTNDPAILANVRLMNGIAAGAEPEPGSRIKLVVPRQGVPEA